MGEGSSILYSCTPYLRLSSSGRPQGREGDGWKRKMAEAGKSINCLLALNRYFLSIPRYLSIPCEISGVADPVPPSTTLVRKRHPHTAAAPAFTCFPLLHSPSISSSSNPPLPAPFAPAVKKHNQHTPPHRAPLVSGAKEPGATDPQP